MYCVCIMSHNSFNELYLKTQHTKRAKIHEDVGGI